MSDIINTHSFSFKYNLEQFFSLTEVNIKNILSKNIPDILNKEEAIKEQINNYKSLKTFLGKKRSLKLEENEFEQNKKHFQNSVSINEINDLTINSSLDGDMYIDEEKNKKFSRLYIYNKPLILIKLFDWQSINIELINDNLSMDNEIKNLKGFRYKIYSLTTLNNKLNISNQIEFPKLYDKTIKIENEDIYFYLLLINNKIPEIKDSDMLFENIYKLNQEENNGLIAPSNISNLFFYYFRISDDLQKKYNYIENDKRKKLYLILAQFLKNLTKNLIIIVGPKGIGKTTSLIKFSFQKEFRIFYFNLESFEINFEEIKKKELKIQLEKLFGEIKQNDNEKNIKNEIKKYIEEYKNNNGLEFIYNIINLFKDFTKNAIGINFGFIIDQYSPNYKNNSGKYDINMIINLINNSNNIKLILCPTINNSFSKEQMNFIFSKSLETDNQYFDIYYFQEFISKDEFIKFISTDKNDVFDELGYSPKHFYELNNINLPSYKNYLEDRLNNNIKEYYLNNNKKEDKIINMNIEILNLLDLIKGEKLISSLELRNNISKYPLKYLKITKYKINDEIINDLSNKFIKKNEKEEILIKYLTLLWNNEKNNEYDAIIEKNFFIEEKNIQELINDNYIERDQISLNIYGDYYKDFINSYESYFDPSKHEYDYIYVYKLDFSINFLENILLNNLYEHIQKENLFLSKILDRGACGGIFELLLGYYIQKNGSFFGEKIEQTIYIPSLVPNNYSITYYSSFNKKIKNFKEFKLDKKENRRKISFKNTFIKQIKFNSKYYDMAILIKSNKNNSFKLLVIQATIMKDADKRLSKEEHELVLRIVKINLENEFNINIEEASFIYVLSKKDGNIQDQKTKIDCEYNKIAYIGFDIEDHDNNNEYKIELKDTFITNSFPIHNSASLLALQNKKNLSEYLKYKVIIDKNISSSQVLKDYNEYIKKLFKNKYDSSELSEDQFRYFNLQYKLYAKNKNILNYLSDFSFCIFIGIKGEDKDEDEDKDKYIYIYFNNSTYDCIENKTYSILKIKSSDIKQILFCYSSIPLAIKNSENNNI